MRKWILTRYKKDLNYVTLIKKINYKKEKKEKYRE